MFHKKYLKYKSKYLSLKNRFKQSGGANVDIGKLETADLITYLQNPNFTGKPDGLFTNEEVKVLSDYNTSLFVVDVNSAGSNVNGIELNTIGDGKVNVMKVELNEPISDMPILFVFAGLSKKSALGTARVIFNSLSILKKKFKAVYIMETSIYSGWQVDACSKIRDVANNTSNEKFIGELLMNQEIADVADKIIKELGLVNVHLLGKCNGAWIALNMLLNEKGFPIETSKYKALYLAVPGIPTGVESLSEIPKNKRDSLSFLFGWTVQDGFNFKGWGKKSYEEPNRYSEQLTELGLDKDKIIKRYNVDGEPHESIYHEIHPGMIEEIVNRI